jgi:hypothetical protein
MWWHSSSCRALPLLAIVLCGRGSSQQLLWTRTAVKMYVNVSPVVHVT